MVDTPKNPAHTYEINAAVSNATKYAVNTANIGATEKRYGKNGTKC